MYISPLFPTWKSYAIPWQSGFSLHVRWLLTLIWLFSFHWWQRGLGWFNLKLCFLFAFLHLNVMGRNYDMKTHTGTERERQTGRHRVRERERGHSFNIPTKSATCTDWTYKFSYMIWQLKVKGLVIYFWKFSTEMLHQHIQMTTWHCHLALPYHCPFTSPTISVSTYFPATGSGLQTSATENQEYIRSLLSKHTITILLILHPIRK